MAADRDPTAGVIAYGLPATPLLATAVVVTLAVPVTPLVPSVSQFTNPLTVAVSVGFATPYARVWLSAVTVRCALVIVKLPGVKMVKS